MNRRSINFNSILDWTFLILAVVCICIVTPMSYTSDKKPSYQSTKPDINVTFVGNSADNYEKFLELLNSENKSLDMIFNNEVPLPDDFISAIKNATDRGVKVRVYTMKSNLTLPKGAELRFFTNTTFFKKFYVNFAIFHSEFLFFPSSFIPRAGFGKKVVGFYANTNDNNTITLAQIIFDYFWNMGDNGYFILPNKYFSQQPAIKNFNFTLDPVSELAINRPSILSAVQSALDQSAEIKMVASRQIFPDNYLNFQESLKYAQLSSLLESQAITDIKLKIYLSRSEFNTHKAQYVSIYHSFSEKNNIDLCECPIDDVDGTIIAASDEFVLIPCGLDEITHNNVIVFGLFYKSDIINDFKTFANDLNCAIYPHHLR